MYLLPHGAAQLHDGAYGEGRATSTHGTANLHDGAYGGGAGPRERRQMKPYLFTDDGFLAVAPYL
jgi:hypothetical protein